MAVEVVWVDHLELVHNMVTMDWETVQMGMGHRDTWNMNTVTSNSTVYTHTCTSGRTSWIHLTSSEREKEKRQMNTFHHSKYTYYS